MSKLTKAQQADKAEALLKLHEILKPGAKIHAEVLHVSRSGMSRNITFLAVDPRDGDLVRLDYWMSRALDLRVSKRGGLTVGGCGMDMCFHTVYCLGRALWPNGTDVPHGTRNGVADSNGGYALKVR